MDANCLNCDARTGMCITCKENYELKNGICKNMGCGDLAVKVLLSGSYYCLTKYNIGDIAGLNLPSSGITLVSVGSACSYSCCFVGATGSPAKCNSNNGSYSGCKRTVCDWRAASKICSSLTYLNKTWNLPTSNQWTLISQQMDSISTGQGDNGIMLCDYYVGSTSITSCPFEMYNMGNNVYYYMYPHDVWSNDAAGDAVAYAFRQTNGALSGPTLRGKDMRFSVRCIAPL